MSEIDELVRDVYNELTSLQDAYSISDSDMVDILRLLNKIEDADGHFISQIGALENKVEELEGSLEEMVDEKEKVQREVDVVADDLMGALELIQGAFKETIRISRNE